MPIGVPDVNAEGQWTFLEIVQRYVQECGISHTMPLKPFTVLNQVGELKRAVDNCAEAWFDIQALHQNWRFKHRDITKELLQGTAEYTSAEMGVDPGTFGRWDKDSFRIYRTGAIASEIPLSFIDYMEWRDTYQIGALRSAQSWPIQLTILPNDGLGFGLVPASGLTVTGKYWTCPIRMEADEDVPELPFKHSPMIIVYYAMLHYGYFNAASEVLARAERFYGQLLRTLEIDQLPRIKLAGALA